MFKCEVTGTSLARFSQETFVYFKISNKGNSNTKNHTLVGTRYNSCFIIGQIDKSIKKGDLIRCDGLPYMSRPANKRNKWKYVKNCIGLYCKEWYTEEAIPGYEPVQLDSGYWVYRKCKKVK